MKSSVDEQIRVCGRRMFGRCGSSVVVQSVYLELKTDTFNSCSMFLEGIPSESKF